LNVSTHAPDISVVILCYRSEHALRPFVASMKEVLERRGLDYELVLVANFDAAGPPDRTPDIAKEIARGDDRITVLARPKEGMMGWDMRSGLAAARGNTVAVIDGDGQMPAEDALAVYDLLLAGGHDMAKTYRKERRDGLVRIVVSRVYNVVLKLLFPEVEVRDANSKPKIFTRQALSRLALTSDDWFIDAEIVIQATRLGLSIGETPTIFLASRGRASFITTSAILAFIRDLLAYRRRHPWR
jgi:glycosyltransferase involved in cell wall biosynthesis